MQHELLSILGIGGEQGLDVLGVVSVELPVNDGER